MCDYVDAHDLAETPNRGVPGYSPIMEIAVNPTSKTQEFACTLHEARAPAALHNDSDLLTCVHKTLAKELTYKCVIAPRPPSLQSMLNTTCPAHLMIHGMCPEGEGSCCGHSTDHAQAWHKRVYSRAHRTSL